MHSGLHPMLNMAIRAARKAGDYIYQASEDLNRVRFAKKSDNSFVTNIDENAQSKIIDVLESVYPDHHFIGEEVTKKRAPRVEYIDEDAEEDTFEKPVVQEKNSDYVWYIDPLDGTTNFLHGLPYYAVSIALVYKGMVEHAVIYNPINDELFYASRGTGAFLNNRRLRVNPRQSTEEFLLASNLWFSRHNKNHQQNCEKISQETAGLRRTGCSALDLASVAAGRLDGFFASGLNPWDMAAGSLLVQEAGGYIGTFSGDKYHVNTQEIIAANPKVYTYLVSQLR